MRGFRGGRGICVGLTGENRSIRVPTSIPDAGRPVAGMTVDLVSVVDHVGMSWSGARCGFADVHCPLHRAVHVPDPDAAVFTAAIHVSGVCAPSRTEVASNERLEDAVAPECHNRAIVGVGFIGRGVIRVEPIIEIRGITSKIHGSESVRTHHLPQIPQFHHLIFAVA
jgi:hypothetical protein